MAPQTTANTWLKYSIPNGAFKGLSLNGGFQYVGKRNTFTPDFSLPAFTTTDAGLNYRRSGVNFGLNVYNLTNERHYTGGYGRGIFWAGMPRSFRATLGYSF
jgi:iron complex outermembrane receptor protein